MLQKGTMETDGAYLKWTEPKWTEGVCQIEGMGIQEPRVRGCARIMQFHSHVTLHATRVALSLPVISNTPNSATKPTSALIFFAARHILATRWIRQRSRKLIRSAPAWIFPTVPFLVLFRNTMANWILSARMVRQMVEAPLALRRNTKIFLLSFSRFAGRHPSTSCSVARTSSL